MNRWWKISRTLR